MRLYIFNRLRVFDVALVIAIFTLFLSKVLSDPNLDFSFSDPQSEAFIKEIDIILTFFFLVVFSFVLCICQCSPFTITKSILLREGDRVLVKVPKKKILSSGLVIKQNPRNGYGMEIQFDTGNIYNVPAKHITKILDNI